MNIQGYMINDTEWTMYSPDLASKMEIGSGEYRSLHLIFQPLSKGTIYARLVVRTNLGVCIIPLRGNALDNVYRIGAINQITMKRSYVFFFFLFYQPMF